MKTIEVLNTEKRILRFSLLCSYYHIEPCRGEPCLTYHFIYEPTNYLVLVDLSVKKNIARFHSHYRYHPYRFFYLHWLSSLFNQKIKQRKPGSLREPFIGTIWNLKDAWRWVRSSFFKKNTNFITMGELYFLLLNTLEQILNCGYHYWQCYKYQGGETEFNDRQYCYLCQILIIFSNFERNLNINGFNYYIYECFMSQRIDDLFIWNFSFGQIKNWLFLVFWSRQLFRGAVVCFSERNDWTSSVF